MSELRDLYQELIIDHGRRPRNFGELSSANHIREGFNPLCGDKLVVYVSTKDNQIEDVKFKGSGCAISVASASLMTEALKGKNLEEARELFTQFHEVVTGQVMIENLEHLGKLQALAGVSEFPARVKCASLCWHTLIAALDSPAVVPSTLSEFSDDEPVRTE